MYLFVCNDYITTHCYRLCVYNSAVQYMGSAVTCIYVYKYNIDCVQCLGCQSVPLSQSFLKTVWKALTTESPDMTTRRSLFTLSPVWW